MEVTVMEIILKYCKKCGSGKPSTEEYFSIRSDTQQLNSQCKECKSKKRREHYINNKEKALIQSHNWKIENKDRRKEVHKVWYNKNKDRILERSRNKYYENVEYERNRSKEYGIKNKSKKSELRKSRYILNKGKENEQAKKWYNENKSQHLINGNNWRKQNPDAARALLEKYRARKLNAGGNYTQKDVKRQYNRQYSECFYCGEKLNNFYHVDHVVPLSRGGTNHCGNIVIACPSCNSSKSNKYITEWKLVCV